MTNRELFLAICSGASAGFATVAIQQGGHPIVAGFLIFYAAAFTLICIKESTPKVKNPT